MHVYIFQEIFHSRVFCSFSRSTMSAVIDTSLENLQHNEGETCKITDQADETCQSNLKITETYKEKYKKINEEAIKYFDADGNPILFNGVELSQLTKSQLKKYRKMLRFEAVKKQKRIKERLKTKKKKQEAKLNNIDLGPSRKQLKKSTMATSTCKTSVVIDLSFDNLMIPKDLSKVIKQVLRVYTENRRSATPMQLHLTSFKGKCREEMEKHNGYQHWDLNFHEHSYLDVFDKEKLVYLSSESENIIKRLDDDKAYIIGGLVDHNSHKGICYQKALQQGIQHGQLPIGEYFHFKHRKVFTINQVFEILLRVTEGKSFKEAFESTLPRRINMQPNHVEGNEDNYEESESDKESDKEPPES